MSKTAENYTAEQTTALVTAYKEAKTHDDRANVVKTQAKALGKTEPSIRMKLVREGVYVKKEKTSKTGGAIVRKDELIEQLCKNTEKDAHFFRSLENVTKDVLQFFVDITAPESVEELDSITADAE